MAADETVKPEKAKLNDPFAHVPRVAEIAPEEGARTPEGELIRRDEYGRAYTESTPQTGGIRTYLDESEYPPELPDGPDGQAIAPPPLRVTPPQAAASAASQFDPHPPVEQPVLQTSATQEPIHPAAGSAPAAGVPTFSTNADATAAAKKAAAPAATQAVIDAVLAHPAAQRKS